jgi:hypothetical protein
MRVEGRGGRWLQGAGGGRFGKAKRAARHCVGRSGAIHLGWFEGIERGG